MSVTRLINSASSCYLNSALQGLSACPKLIEEFKNLETDYPDVNSLKIFNELLDIITSGKSSKVNASKNSLFLNWKKSGQQDSFELLTYAIGEVYKEMRNKSGANDLETWLNKELPMRIIIEYDIKCVKKHLIKCPKQFSLALHVPIPDKLSDYSIQKLVDEYLGVGEIEDYICDKCKELESSNEQENNENKAQKFTKILSPLPHTICIHVQRTKLIKGVMRKITNKLNINEKLKINYNDKDEENFELKAVIVHYGFIYFGHYICYKLDHKKWYYTSDSTVYPVPFNSVIESEPYILFYEKS